MTVAASILRNKELGGRGRRNPNKSLRIKLGLEASGLEVAPVLDEWDDEDDMSSDTIQSEIRTAHDPGAT